MKKIAAVCLMLIGSLCSYAQSNQKGHKLDNEYLVGLNSGEDVDAVEKMFKKKYGIKILYTYRYALNGFLMISSADTAASISQEPSVSSVELNGIVHIAGVTGPWRLNGVNQKNLPLDLLLIKDWIRDLPFLR